MPRNYTDSYLDVFGRTILASNDNATDFAAESANIAVSGSQVLVSGDGITNLTGEYIHNERTLLIGDFGTTDDTRLCLNGDTSSGNHLYVFNSKVYHNSAYRSSATNIGFGVVSVRTHDWNGNITGLPQTRFANIQDFDSDEANTIVLINSSFDFINPTGSDRYNFLVTDVVDSTISIADGDAESKHTQHLSLIHI